MWSGSSWSSASRRCTSPASRWVPAWGWHSRSRPPPGSDRSHWSTASPASGPRAREAFGGSWRAGSRARASWSCPTPATRRPAISRSASTGSSLSSSALTEPRSTIAAMWLGLALAAALFQVLRNTAMKRLGHALDEYINVWGRFTFLLPFALATCLLGGWPAIRPGFFSWCAVFGVSQTISTLALSKALKVSEISLVTALWKVSLIILLGMAYVSIGERPSALGVAGVLLSASGVYLLNVRRARISPWAPLTVLFTDPGQRWTLVAAVFYAPSAVTMKQAIVTSA